MSQEQTHWCWAAVAAAVGAHVTGTGPVRQCDIAAVVLNAPNCCANPGASNLSAGVEDALAAVQVGARVLTSAGFEFSHLVQEVVHRRLPVGARVVDTNGVAHVVLLVGCDQVAETVVCADPWGTVGLPAPRYRMPFLTMKNSYGGWGACSHVCVIG